MHQPGPAQPFERVGGSLFRNVWIAVGSKRVFDWLLELVGWQAASPFKRGLVRLTALVMVGAAAAVVAVLLGR